MSSEPGRAHHPGSARAGRRAELRRRLQRLRHPLWFGTLRRTRPLSDHWGRERGTPIDRWYIEAFLEEHRADITGRVLEVRDAGYTSRFGHGLIIVDIVDIDHTNRRATIRADLSVAGSLPAGTFNAIVLTQVLQYVTDVPAAIANLAQALAPGGVLLISVPCIGRIGRSDVDIDRWRFTPTGLEQLLEAAFGDAELRVGGRGNVLAAIAFLAGAAAEELAASDLETDDPSFPVVSLARAVRPTAT